MRWEPRMLIQMNAHRGKRTALDYEESSSYIFKLVVTLATNPAWIGLDREECRSLLDGPAAWSAVGLHYQSLRRVLAR
jgi:hypothetical protein